MAVKNASFFHGQAIAADGPLNYRDLMRFSLQRFRHHP